MDTTDLARAVVEALDGLITDAKMLAGIPAAPTGSRTLAGFAPALRVPAADPHALARAAALSSVGMSRVMTAGALERLRDAVPMPQDAKWWGLANAQRLTVMFERATLDEMRAWRDAWKAYAERVVVPAMNVTDGATGIRTSILGGPVHVEVMTVSGAGSVGIDLDE